MIGISRRLIFPGGIIMGIVMSKDAEIEFYCAAYRGDVEGAESILQKFPEIKHELINSECLFCAIRHGQQEFVEFLIENKVDLRAIDRSALPSSALDVAILVGNEEIACMLLDAGIDLTIGRKDHLLQSALLRRMENLAVALLLKNIPYHFEPALLLAMRYKLIDVVILLRMLNSSHELSENFHQEISSYRVRSNFISLIKMPAHTFMATREVEAFFEEYPFAVSRFKVKKIERYSLFAGVNLVESKEIGKEKMVEVVLSDATKKF